MSGKNKRADGLRIKASHPALSNYEEQSLVSVMPRRRYGQLSRIILPKVFLRACRLPLTAFRVLCHGLTYETGWSVQKCCAETGINKRGVQVSLARLSAMGYVLKHTNRNDKRRIVYRFYPVPHEVIQEYQSMNDEPLI